MTETQLLEKIKKLDPSAKKEVKDFVEFLLDKQIHKIQKAPKFGCASGLFKMSSDFDEPLEDMKDYMG